MCLIRLSKSIVSTQADEKKNRKKKSEKSTFMMKVENMASDIRIYKDHFNFVLKFIHIIIE